MRTIKIEEVDSGCFIITTKDFQDNDAVKYSWDQLPQSFYGEYQMATIDKRQFQRETFNFADYPTIGDAINFILKRDTELMNERWKAQIDRRRAQLHEQ